MISLDMRTNVSIEYTTSYLPSREMIQISIVMVQVWRHDPRNSKQTSQCGHCNGNRSYNPVFVAHSIHIASTYARWISEIWNCVCLNHLSACSAGNVLITIIFAVLEEGIFMRTVSEDFFRGDMSRFFKTNNNRVKKNTRGSKKLTYETIDSAQVLALVGESITNFLSDVATENHAEVAVEDLNGNISTTSLRRWTSQLPKLKILSLVSTRSIEIALC